MTVEEFSAGNWIKRLAQTLPDLAEEQRPYLREYHKHNPRAHFELKERYNNPQVFPLDDLRDLYSMAFHSYDFGEEKHYAALNAVLNPVRGILRSHPTLAQVMSPIIGRDDFWMQILSSGSSTSLTDLTAGLMARAYELSSNGFQTAATELSAFLVTNGEDKTTGMPDDLDVGYNMLLFYGLTLKEKIDIGEEMAILPFEQVQTFVNEHLLEELAPPGAGSNSWQSVGAVVKPFRWKPKFQRTGDERYPRLDRSEPFFREAQTLLELLAVAHKAPLLPLAALPYCINRSASRLLGWSNHSSGSYHRGRPAQEFDGFKASPELVSEVLAEAREAFENRGNNQYGTMAPIVSRLAEALARSGQFATEDQILDVAIALERIFKPKGGRISAQLQKSVADLLGGEDQVQSQMKEAMKHFYDVRSAIIHGPKDAKKMRLLEEKNKAFNAGFSLARRSLFKMLRDGSPQQ